MRTAFHTAFLGDYPVLDAVRLIKDHGYDEVELNAEALDWAVPHVSPETDTATRRKLTALGPYSAISAHRLDLGDRSSEVRAAGVEWTKAMLQLATELGTEVVHVIPGTGKDIPGLYDSLNRIVEASYSAGVTVGLEAVVNQLVNDRAGIEATLQAVPGLRLNFDPSHLQVHDGDVVATATVLGALVDHVALKDSHGTPDAFSFDPLGAGNVDFLGMLHALMGHGYDGVVSVEHESHLFGDTRPVPQVLAASLTFTHALLEAVERDR